MLTRRQLILGAAGTAGGTAALGLDRLLAGDRTPAPQVALAPAPPGLPACQHAWDHTLARDRVGNPIAPRFDRLLFFALRARPRPDDARSVEAVLRTLERTYPWSPAGLLFTVAYGPRYFERSLGIRSPIPQARALSDFEVPAIDEHELCLHLACDDERRLAAIEAALTGRRPLAGAPGPLDLTRILRHHETRTGFTGAGLPARHQRVGGIPGGNPVARDAPLFMGFASNLRRNQAGEDAVTIPHGPLAGATTMHVSYMRLRLDSWYRGLSERERVARMYAPQVSPEQAHRLTTDAPSDPDRLQQAITRYGVVGHAQTSARARRNGKPLILRRDFNTVDGGQAGLHFVSLQRTIEDFITTRTAMNAAHAQLQNPAIGDTVNNGINEFIFVTQRGNYLIPPRRQRALPLLLGRERALVPSVSA